MKQFIIDNLEYIRMEGFDECCGLNGLSNFKEYGILSNASIITFSLLLK